MKLTLPTVLILAIFANLLPGCGRLADDREAASSGASKDQVRKGEARSAPAQSSGSY